MTEFANFIYLTVFINSPPGVKKYFYYPGSGVTYCSSFKKESRSWGIENDITGGPPFSFEFKVSENAVCCAYEVADLLEYKRLGINPPKKIKSPEGNNHLLNIIESSSINDNPILQIVKLK